MPTRQRIIYNNEALYVGPSPATGVHSNTPLAAQSNISEIHRVQSINYSLNISREDVNQFGELARIDSIILESPTTSMDFTYLVNGMYNEASMGFHISSGAGEASAISGILAETEEEKNYFVRLASAGEDVHSNVDLEADPVIALGNGFITNYTAEGSVGNFPTVTINVEGLNMEFESANSGNVIPAVNPVDGSATYTGRLYTLPSGIRHPQGYNDPNIAEGTVSVLRPGDITLDLGYAEGGPLISDAKIQSYSIGVDLAREPLNKLGTKYAFARVLSLPLSTTMSVTMDVGDQQSGSLIDMISNDSTTTYDPSVKIVAPGAASTAPAAAFYQLKQAKVDSIEFSSSIGSNKSCTINWSAQVGSAEQTDRGIFFSGNYFPPFVYTTEEFPP